MKVTDVLCLALVAWVFLGSREPQPPAVAAPPPAVVTVDVAGVQGVFSLVKKAERLVDDASATLATVNTTGVTVVTQVQPIRPTVAVAVAPRCPGGVCPLVPRPVIVREKTKTVTVTETVEAAERGRLLRPRTWRLRRG